MTALIHRICNAQKTISVSILTAGFLHPDAEITRLEMGGVQLTTSAGPDILITVDDDITKANLAGVSGSDPDSTVDASAIIDAASLQENLRERSAAIIRGHR